MPALPRATPDEQGVDAAAIAGLLDALAAGGVELHSLMLMRHGTVVAEAHWAPYEEEQVNLLYSLSKSFVSAAAGIAVSEKRFRYDDRVVDLVPELVPQDIGEHWREVTVRDCLRMATGHLDDPVLYAEADWLAAFLRLPPDWAPGSVFTYNQFATHTVARLVEASAGERLVDYLRPRLFEPLGVGHAGWFTDGHGHDAGFSGLHVSTDAIARFGQLLLQRGEWDGRQLVPAEWVDEATSIQMPNDLAHRRPGVDADELPVDWAQGYGYQFWMCRNGFRGDGAYGQFCLVLPEQDAVLALTSETTDMQRVLDAVWQHLLPGLSGDAGAGSADADAALATRLAEVAIPLPPNDRSGDGFEPVARTSGDAAASVDSVALRREGTGWVADFRHGDRVRQLPIGDGQWVAGDWTDGVPFRSAGGFVDGRFRAQLRMIQTPHTIELSVDAAAGTACLQWSQPPLHGPEPSFHRLR
ncbi:serine hydrolase domain-containing protein [Flexivirga meconopsidis]|uniref:serine hydrolase domain-containing protein n=1 Tax=Flexivirga meconopsidis TaxID=2977121 RepID=UPI002240B7B3